MALEDRGAQHDKVVVDKYVNPVANYQMTTFDYVLRPEAEGIPMGGVGPFTITLPYVSEAKGRFYSFVCRNADAVNTITITHRNDSECWVDIVLNGKCDRVLLYSDGLCWHAIGQVLTFVGTTAVPTTVGPTTVAPTTIAPISVAPTTNGQ